MSRFFIHRPIVAIVISIFLVMLGAITLAGLPVSQYPSIVPPEVQIIGQYFGADAITKEQSVAVPIEQQMSGVDDLNYMQSLSTANGPVRMVINFDVKSDPNLDLMLTQMRATQASTQLPSDVVAQGLTVRKSLSAPLMLVALYSPHNTYDAKFLANYAYINLNDQFTRVPGIGNVQVFGAGQYAMRLWVQPDKMAKLGLTVPDVLNAVQAQNTVNPAGQIGAEPVPQGQEFTYTVRAQGRLVSPEDFENIVVRENKDGGVVRLRDVARVELGAQDYSLAGRLNGSPAAIMAIYQLPGSNALQAAEGVKKLLAEIKHRLPTDVDYAISLDTTMAVSEGIREIAWTFGIALALVVLVVYLFLQNWRATLIPLLAVPVSLVGTFLTFPLFGFSVNTLSLFGLVLAIGLVVDDAIVVVEAVERHIEEGLAPKAAALKAMEEITAPVIGIALVLSAVFVPTVFVPGITGRLYQQFAVTIAVSVVISAFNALSLSPALAALLLRRRDVHERRGFFGWFNRMFERGTSGYVRGCSLLMRRGAITLIGLGAFAAGAVFISGKVPTSFLPDEDMGYAFVNLQLPTSASMQRTRAVASKVEKIIEGTPGVKYTTSVLGFSLLSTVQTTYNAFFFVTLKEWSDRTKRDEQLREIQQRLNRELGKIPEAISFSFPPPAIPGVGTSSGFTFVLEDRAGKSIQFLSDSLKTFLDAAKKRPEIGSLNSTFLPSVPQAFIDVDRDRALKQGVALSDVYRTIQAFMGGVFVNYFNRFGRQWQVYVEAEGAYRNDINKLGQFFVRNDKGVMVPLSGLTHYEMRPGPEFVMHYNLYRAAQINGSAAPGYSSAQAMKALEEVFAQTMPREMGYDYMGMSFQEKKAQEGISPMMVAAMSLVFVFLILAALYESWSLPFSVLLSTPIAVFGAFLALWLRRLFMQWTMPAYMITMENDLYSQIGLVMLIGLAAKNAILIVEFAREERARGRGIVEAALEGARLRLRPILMTSFAFILGCVPLWLASGAGSVARQIMGTTVIGGMLAASIIGIFFVPAIFLLVERISGDAGRADEATSPAAAP
jgi:HAE1 family hydrophobic/amphiphilic exporter-1